MAFKAVLHSQSQKQLQYICKSVLQFRAEKAAKYISLTGVNYSAIEECISLEYSYSIPQEKTKQLLREEHYDFKNRKQTGGQSKSCSLCPQIKDNRNRKKHR